MATVTVYGHKTKTIDIDPEDRFLNETFAIENINWNFTARDAKNNIVTVSKVELLTGNILDDADIQSSKIVFKSDLFRAVVSIDRKTAVITTSGQAGIVYISVTADSNLDPNIVNTISEKASISIIPSQTVSLGLTPTTMGDVFTDMNLDGVDDTHEPVVYGTASHIFKMQPIDEFGNTTKIIDISWDLLNLDHPNTTDPKLVADFYAKIAPSESGMTCVLRPTGKMTKDNIGLLVQATDKEFITYTAPDNTVFTILRTEQIVKYTDANNIDHYVLAGTAPIGAVTTPVNISADSEDIVLNDQSEFQISPAQVETLNISIH
jgi:hypothetical protein